MDTFSLFDCVSPLDFRYYGGDERLFQALSPYVSERARVRYEARVEAALVRVLERRGLCPPEAADAIVRACEEVTPEEVAAEERRIHHNVRALVNAIRARVPEEARRFVHWTLTSFDVIDTAMAARFQRATREAVIPALVALEIELIAIAEREADTLQMGRTHLAACRAHHLRLRHGRTSARLGERIRARFRGRRHEGQAERRRGRSNASSLFLDDPEAFEREVLAELGLEPGSHSTQVVAVEPMTDLIHVMTSCLGVMANLADDMRHLQRSEITEVGEAFEKDQVGSSTMPHKRNPWNFENVKASSRPSLHAWLPCTSTSSPSTSET